MFTALLLAALPAPGTLSAGAHQSAEWTIVDARQDYVDGNRLTASSVARSQLARMALCMWERHPDRVRDALALPMAESIPAVVKLVDSSCLDGGMLKMPAPVLRGSLWAARFRAARPKLPATPSDLGAGLGNGSSDAMTLMLRNVADCLWRTDMADVQTVLLTIPGSGAEDKAYAGLQDHLRPCSPARPIRFSKSTLSGLLAEVAFLETQARTDAAEPVKPS